VATFAVILGLAIALPALAQSPSLSPETSLRIANEQLRRSDLTPRQKAQNLILRAEAYWLLGRTEDAFADLAQAEPLDAQLLPLARVQRALILSRSLGQLDQALAALDSLPPQHQTPHVKIMRGEVLMALGRHANAAATLEPIYRAGGDLAVRARRLLAQAYFNMGEFKKSVPLYDEMLIGASERQDRQYAALWRFAAERMAGLEGISRLRNDTRPSDRLTWPGPIIKYLLGDLSATELLQTAQSVMARGMGGTCEAPFFIGVVEEKAGRPGEARNQYLQAVAPCHSGMFERWGAEARLKNLK
jgi:tetratricopeptide (TPR) repeat protein